MSYQELYRNTTVKDSDGNITHEGDNKFYTEPKGKGKCLAGDDCKGKDGRAVSAGRGVYFFRPDKLERGTDEYNAFQEFVAIHRVTNMASGSDGRVSKAAIALDALINMTNRSAYRWNEKQRDKVIGLLQSKLDELTSGLERNITGAKKGTSKAKGYNVTL